MTGQRGNLTLTFAALRLANLVRCRRWHTRGIDDWDINRWAVALGGEVGEFQNAVKKLNRITDKIATKGESSDRIYETEAEAIAAIGAELADSMIYLDLCAARLRLDLAELVIAKFNAVSERMGFPERLEHGSDHVQPAGWHRAIADVAHERDRQISYEGFHPDHDDGHSDGEIAWAAAAYITYKDAYWPWDPADYKPSEDRRRNLVKAAALLLAEIQRLDRAAERK